MNSLQTVRTGRHRRCTSSWSQGMHCRVYPRRLLLLALLLLGGYSQGVSAQTPSPLQEWQYSGGIILARLFQPDLPTWRNIFGVAADLEPVYSGARAYRGSGGPIIDIHYKDVAFFSVGEGFGYNVLHGDHYQVGIGLTYDLGRRDEDDLTNRRGMGDIPAAPVAKLYGSWVLSRKFPLILRVAARQFMGGNQGAI